jgi:proteasome lid subunit RPN8/RPN11
MTTPAPRPASSPAPERLTLPDEVRVAMLNHAAQTSPLEACGLVGVDARGRVRMFYPLTNDEASPHRFTISPPEHFGAVCHAEARGWEIGAVFHSHPGGGAAPSPTDIAQPHDPAWVHFIAGFVPRAEVRAWRIVEGRTWELGLVVS